MPLALPPRVVGKRIQAAREALGWTQMMLARKMKLRQNQTISHLETGSRAARPSELREIANLLKVPLSFFQDPFLVTGQAQWYWRADPALPDSMLCKSEHTLGRWTGLLRWLLQKKPAPEVFPLSGFSACARMAPRLTMDSPVREIQQFAQWLARQLRLGDLPASCLADRLPWGLNVHVGVTSLPFDENERHASMAICHLPELDVIYLDCRDNEAVRAYNLAVGLFHALTWGLLGLRYRESNPQCRLPSGKTGERMADIFAHSLLFPASLAHGLALKEPPGASALLQTAARMHVPALLLADWAVQRDWLDKTSLPPEAALRLPRTPPANLPATPPNLLLQTAQNTLQAGAVTLAELASAFELTETTLGCLLPASGAAPAAQD